MHHELKHHTSAKMKGSKPQAPPPLDPHTKGGHGNYFDETTLRRSKAPYGGFGRNLPTFHFLGIIQKSEGVTLVI
jgi:hypothetical protein